MQEIPHRVKELDGFTNIETKALYNWIRKNINKLEHVEKFLNKDISDEEFGDLILESFLSNMDLDNFGSVFYDVIVEKALISIYWDEVGERLLKNKEEVKATIKANETIAETTILKNWLQKNPTIKINSEKELAALIKSEAKKEESNLIEQLLEKSIHSIDIAKIT